jgi:5-hydroxyisourate hydrolase
MAAVDVDVKLRRQQETTAWTELASGRTAVDGRWAFSSDRLHHGVYQIELDIDGYYAPLGVLAFHPRVIVEFRIVDSSQDLHLPVLITPNSLLAYQGHQSEAWATSW